MEQIAVSRTEAAKLLGVALPTITRWVKSGRLSAFNSGGRILISVRALHKLVGDKEEQKEIDPQRTYHNYFKKLDGEQKVNELKNIMMLM